MFGSYYIPSFFLCQAFCGFFGIIPKFNNCHLCTITMVDFSLFKCPLYDFATLYFVLFKYPLHNFAAGILLISAFQKHSYRSLTKSLERSKCIPY
jgi:hypothetical protein